MKKLILISGKARSGKDSFVNYLMEDLDNAQVLDITGGLKEVVCNMFDISGSILESQKDKEVVSFAVPDHFGYTHKNFTVRHFLQFIGNEIAPPLLGKFHWCMERQHKLFSVDRDVNILCGVRQLKEIEYFTKMNPDKKVIVVKLERTKDGAVYSPISDTDKSHSTETEVDLIEPHYTYSCENLDEVKKAAKDLYNKLSE